LSADIDTELQFDGKATLQQIKKKR